MTNGPHLSASATSCSPSRVSALLQAAAVNVLLKRAIQSSRQVLTGKSSRRCTRSSTHPLKLSVTNVRLVAAEALWFSLCYGQQQDRVARHCSSEETFK